MWTEIPKWAHFLQLFELSAWAIKFFIMLKWTKNGSSKSLGSLDVESNSPLVQQDSGFASISLESPVFQGKERQTLLTYFLILDRQSRSQILIGLAEGHWIGRCTKGGLFIDKTFCWIKPAFNSKICGDIESDIFYLQVL